VRKPNLQSRNPQDQLIEAYLEAMERAVKVINRFNNPFTRKGRCAVHQFSNYSKYE
jgi:hypothetical protein